MATSVPLAARYTQTSTKKIPCICRDLNPRLLGFKIHSYQLSHSGGRLNFEQKIKFRIQFLHILTIQLQKQIFKRVVTCEISQVRDQSLKLAIINFFSILHLHPMSRKGLMQLFSVKWQTNFFELFSVFR
jgi:hypothetical protein